MKTKAQLIDNRRTAASIESSISLITEAAAALTTRTGRPVTIVFFDCGEETARTETPIPDKDLQKNISMISELLAEVSEKILTRPEFDEYDKKTGSFNGGMTFGILEAIDEIDEDGQFRKAFHEAMSAEDPLAAAEKIITESKATMPGILQFAVREYLKADKISKEQEGKEPVSLEMYRIFTTGLEYGRYLLKTEYLKQELKTLTVR